MNLHICHGDKFIPAYVDFVNENFNQDKNYFYLMYFKNKSPIANSQNISNYKNFLSFFDLLLKLFQADKVIVHGLFHWKLLTFLFCNLWVLKKSYWVIWGGDLYGKGASSKLINFIYMKMKGIIIKRFGFLVTYVPGDVEFARKHFKAQGQYRECIVYLSNIVTEEIEFINSSNETKNILVGNSAADTNNHLVVFDILKKMNDQNFKIISPLSYGSPSYRNIIIAEGNKNWGSRFQSITDFMPYASYLNLLSQVDIAIFAHNRQQAMGNIIQLLARGKTIYLKNQTTTSEFLEKLGVSFFYLTNSELKILDVVTRQHNKEIIENYFSINNLKKQLEILCG